MKRHLKLMIPAAAVVLVLGVAAIGPLPIYLLKLSALQVGMDYASPASPAIIFSAPNLDPLVDNNPTDGNQPFYRYFLDMGDGQYKMGDNISELATFQYTYATQGNKFPFMEVAYAYDKDKKKKQNLARIGPDGSDNGSNPDSLFFNHNRAGTATSMPQASFASGESVKIITTGPAVKGAFYTAVITYKCPSTAQLNQRLDLKITPGGLNPYMPRTYLGESAPTISNGNMVLRVPAFTSMTQQRNLIAHFEIDTLGEPNVSLDAQLCDTLGNNCSPVASVTQTIADSHDPNVKIASEKILCNSGTTIRYTIHFQNDGKGPVDTILIKDELDPYISFPTSISVINRDSKLPAPSIAWTDDTHRELVFRFDNVGLKGSGSNRYGIDYGYDETAAWFSFDVTVHQAPGCNAICNNARIFFDHNTPIETGTLVTPIGCDKCDSVCMVIDTSAFATMPFPNYGVNMSGLFPDFYNNINAGGYDYFKWYPSEFASNWNVLNTTFTAPRPMQYTLVASKDCQRFVFQVFIDRPCFNISYNAGTLACFDDITQVTAQATPIALSSSASHWVWSNGKPGAAPTTFEPVSAGINYIGITDTLTGCSKEIKVNIAAPPPIYIQDDPNDNQANLIVTGGTPGYTYHFSMGGSTFTSPGPNVLLNGATSFDVTVTDTYGCTAVFSGKGKNKIVSGGGWGWQEIAILAGALLVLGGLIVYLWNKQSPSNPG